MALWTPKNLTSVTLVGWYRLRDPNGVIANGADAFDGTNVTAWKDRSGLGNDLPRFPNNSPSDMVYKPNGFGAGYPSIHLSGIYYGTGWFGPITSPTGKFGSFASIINASGQASSGDRIVSIGAVSGGGSGNQDYSSPNGIVLYQDGTDGTNITTLYGNSASATVTPDVPLIAGSYFKGNDTQGLAINGSELSALSRSYDNTPANLGLGTNGAYSGAYWTGDFSEVVNFIGTLSLPDQQKLEGYLAWNTGTQANLPTTHPYYNAAPTITWTPQNLSVKPGKWFDLQNGASITQAGGTISSLSNLGTDAGAAVQTNASWQTNFDGSGLAAGYPAAVFNAGQVLGASMAGLNGPAVSVFIVGQKSSPYRSWRAVSLNGGDIDYADNRYSAIVVGGESADYSAGIERNGFILRSTSTALATPFLVNNGFDGTNAYTAVNGGTADTKPNSAGNLNPSMVTLGGYYNGGSPSGGGDLWYGPLSEVIVLYYTPTTAERQQIEGYLAWKWGIQSSLPSSHPYASAAPTVSQAPPTANATSSVTISNLTTLASVAVRDSAVVGATLPNVISATPKVVTAALSNGNFILGQDGNLLDKVWCAVEANSTPNANGTTYNITASAPPSITPSIQPSVGLPFDGVALLLGPLNASANASQLVTVALKDSSNTTVTSSSIALSRLSVEDPVWVTFMFPTPIVSTTSAWTINLTTESSTPLPVTGNTTAFAVMLREQGLVVPPMNATQSFFVLPDCSGGTATAHTLTLNPDANTSISKLVVSKGCTATFPSSGTYTLRVYDGLYDYSGSSDTDTGIDANLDNYQIINNDYDYGNSYASLGNVTQTATVAAYASATVNSTLQAVTSSSNALAYESATVNQTLAPVTLSSTAGTIDKASSNVTITPVLSVANVAVRVSASASNTFIITSSANVAVTDSASASSTLAPLTSTTVVQAIDSASANNSIGNIVGVSTTADIITATSNTNVDIISSVGTITVIESAILNQSVGPVLSSSVGASLVQATASNSIGTVTGSSQAQVLVSGSANNTLNPIVQNITSGSAINASVSVNVDSITGIANASLIVQGSATNSIGAFVSNINTGSGINATLNQSIGLVTSVAPGAVGIHAQATDMMAPIQATIPASAFASASANNTIGQFVSTQITTDIVSVTVASTLANITSNVVFNAAVGASTISAVGNITSAGTVQAIATANTITQVPNFTVTDSTLVTVSAKVTDTLGPVQSNTTIHVIDAASANVSIGTVAMSGSFTAPASVMVNGIFDNITTTALAKAIETVNAVGTIAGFTSVGTGTVTWPVEGAVVNTSIGVITSSVTTMMDLYMSITGNVAPVLSVASVTAPVQAQVNNNIGIVLSDAKTYATISSQSNGTIGQIGNQTTGKTTIAAGVSATLGSFTNVASGSVKVNTTVPQTIDAIVSDASGTVSIVGSSSTVFGNFSSRTVVKGYNGAVVDASIGDVLCAAEQIVIKHAAVDNTLGEFTSNASGRVRFYLSTGYQMLI